MIGSRVLCYLERKRLLREIIKNNILRKIFFKIGGRGAGEHGCTVKNCGGNSFGEFGNFGFNCLWKRDVFLRGEMGEVQDLFDFFPVGNVRWF